MAEHSPHFPIHPWALKEDSLDASRMVLAETLFSLANGYIGTRGTFEEGLHGYGGSCEGTYLNGLYLRQPIHYEETAYGLASHNHKMIQAPDGKMIRLLIDGEAFTQTFDNFVSHHRELNFRHGVIERKTRWRVDKTREIEVQTKRLVSLTHQHLMAIEYCVTPINFSGEITLLSGLDAGYGEDAEKDEQDPRAGHLSIRESLEQVDASAGNNQLTFLHRIKDSEQLIGSTCQHRSDQTITAEQSEYQLTHRISASLQSGESIIIEKIIAYHDGNASQQNDVVKRLSASIENAPSFGELEKAQHDTLDAFWQQSDLSIDGDETLQQGIRFNLFHILQSAGKDGKRAIGAKGLTGPGYDGHYFWDTEIYIIPFFVFTNPEIARSLLAFRCSLLDASREHAREMSHTKGALYAWRTIGGEECSAFFPAGTAQYHINAAIAYALRQYLDATQDWQFMREGAAEMLFETARIWADIGHFSDTKNGQFCINEVTGPDEYSAMVDNNFYTNAMAKMHLQFAHDVAQKLQQTDADYFATISQQLDLNAAEIELWQRAAKNMYLPHDDAKNITPQDDGFLHKPVWDFAGTPKENHPLLMHYHPLVIYRHQVLKQADVVLAMALLGDQFSDELRRNNLAFYKPLTTHDSTLSTCIYGIESSRAGQMEDAYQFFKETARMDIDNRHHNTEYGLHTACMAGTWMGIVMGFAGMEVRASTLHFRPQLPEGWQGYRFQLRYRDRQLNLTIHTEDVRCELTQGKPIDIVIDGNTVTLSKDSPVVIARKPSEQAA